MPMPILSSGQAVWISSERARYHAIRLNIRVSREMPHRALYPLIDIILVEAGNCPAAPPTGYDFSGYTLADRDWFDTLPAADRQRVYEWLDRPHVRYEIEGARRRLIYDELPDAIDFLPYPAKLYSSLQARLEALPAAAMPARQWQQTLRNLQQQGIGKEELEWSGVMAWLASQAPTVKLGKRDIMAHIDFSAIRLRVSNERVAVEGDESELAYRAKYRHISLFGGEDYREWLVSLPDYRYSYFGPHFTERNVLLHIRTKTRFDSNGRKLLFIEELQSDWHQVTGKNAFTRSRQYTPPAPFRTGWVSLGIKLMLLHAVAEGFAGVAWADGAIQAQRYGAGMPGMQHIYDVMIGKTLLKLARHWDAEITTTHLESKVPWFRIAPIKNKKPLSSKHGFIRSPAYDSCAVLSILARYTATELIQVPVFHLPEDMATHVAEAGLPLFGTSLLLRN